MRGVGTAWRCLLSGRDGVEEASACTDEKRETDGERGAEKSKESEGNRDGFSGAGRARRAERTRENEREREAKQKQKKKKKRGTWYEDGDRAQDSKKEETRSQRPNEKSRLSA